MARDSWNRDVGNLAMKDVAQQMSGPVKNVVETKSPTVENRLTALNDAVKAFAEKTDASATEHLDEAKSWAQNIIGFVKSMASAKKDKDQNKQNTVLERIANATQSLWRASQSQHTIWVGISKLSNQAQQDIARAIKMSGCCGAANTVTNTVMAAANAAAAAAKASNTLRVGTVVADNIEIGDSGGGAGGGGGMGGGTTANPLGGGGGGHGPGRAPTFWGSAMKTFGLAALTKGVNLFQHAISSLDLNPIEGIFKGAIVDELTFRENLRQIIHETQGFGRLNRENEKAIMNIKASVDASGVGRGEFQKIWLKNLERGMAVSVTDDRRFTKRYKGEQLENKLYQRRVTEMKSIQTTAMATASGLHMNADAINELFMDWHFHLGMSALQMGEMERHMKTVARTTGVTGAQLEKSLKASEAIIKVMKKAGTASSAAMKNVTEVMALAEKYGVGESAAEMLTALSSRTNLLQMDPKKALMLRKSAQMADERAMREGRFHPEKGEIGTMEKLQMGALGGDREGIKQLMMGQQDFMKQILGKDMGTLAKAGVLKPGQGLGDIDYTNMSDVIQKLQASGREGMAIAANIQRQLEFMGSSVGDFEQMQKVMQEMALSPFERVQKMGEKLAEMQKKGMTGTDQYNQLLAQQREAQTNLMMDQFGRMKNFSDDLKNNYGRMLPEDVKERIAAGMKDLMPEGEGKKFADNLQASAKDMLSTLDSRAKAAGLDLNELLKKRGVTDVSEATKGLATGDENTLQVVQEAMQEIARKERVKEDPLTEARDYLKDINNQLGEIVKNIAGGLGDLGMKIVLYGGMIVSAISSILTVLVALSAAQKAFDIAKGLGGLGRGGVPPGGGTPRTPVGAPRAPMGGPTMPTGPHVPPGTTNPPGTRPPAPGKATLGPKVAGRPILPNGTRAAPIHARGTPQPKSKWGRLMGWGSKALDYGKRAAGFGKRHADKIGTAAGVGLGAYEGYELSDGNLGWALAGGAAGGLAGNYAGRKIKGIGGGGVAGDLIDAGANAAGMAGGMPGMPGFGQEPVPVFIVGMAPGLGGLAGMIPGLGGGAGGGGLMNAVAAADAAQDAISLADDAASAASATTKALSTAAKVRSGAMAAEEAGVVARTLSKIPGVSKLVGGAEALSAIPGLSKVAAVGSKASGVLGGAGKLLGPLAPVLSGALGAYNAESAGMSKTEGFGYGALTGGVETGSMFSGMLGIQKGSNQDEQMGALGAAAYGASVGSIAGPWGAAVGAIVAEAVEIQKISRNARAAVDEMIKQQTATTESLLTHNEAMRNEVAEMANPAEQLARLKELLSNKEIMAQGMESNLKSSQKALEETGWFSKHVWDMGGAAKAAQSDVNTDKTRLEATQKELQTLNDQIKVLEARLVKPTETTAETMKMGQQKGSIFVHDTHVEAVLLTLLKHFGGMNENTVSEIDQLQQALMKKATAGLPETAARNLGLFDAENVEDATGMHSAANIQRQLEFMNLSVGDLEQLAKAFSSRAMSAPDVSQLDLGILDTSDLRTSDLNNIVSHAIDNKKENVAQNILAEVSRALDYERSASDAADSTKAAEISSNLMDYTDAMKGEVGTLLHTRGNVESSLEQQKYGQEPTNHVMLPSMDTVADYLTGIQLSRLEEMISLLREIKQNTQSRRSASSIVGKGIEAGSPLNGGVKSIARDKLRGYWDLTFSDMSDTTVTTEGRGGSG